MNMVPSNINQWGILSGLLAVIYCWSHGFDRRLFRSTTSSGTEILLTIVQAFLCWLFLASMDLAGLRGRGDSSSCGSSSSLFRRFGSRDAYVYGAWILVAIELSLVTGAEESSKPSPRSPGCGEDGRDDPRFSRRMADLAPSPDGGRGAGGHGTGGGRSGLVDFGLGEPDFATPGVRAGRRASPAIRPAGRSTRTPRAAAASATPSPRSTARAWRPTAPAPTCW
jgi:hypothetical protein